MSRLLDPKRNGRYPFPYTPAATTDVAKTFAKARKEMEAQKKATVTRIDEKARNAKRY